MAYFFLKHFRIGIIQILILLLPRIVIVWLRKFNLKIVLKNSFYIFLLALITIVSISFLPTADENAWGFFGHRKINYQAVFTLPPEMMFFYKKNIDFLTDHSIDPDKRRYASPYEAVRHYIDLDIYGELPFNNVPRTWTDALIQYSDLYFLNEKSDTIELVFRDSTGALLDYDGKMAFHPGISGGESRYIPHQNFRQFFINNFLQNYYDDTWTASCDSLQLLLNISPDSFYCKKLLAVDNLSEHGILPWHLQHMLTRLSGAFLEMDADKIRRYSADIGHYIADAHVPLHTTENYNGQLTGQNGIHAFWESRLPELFADEEYDYWVGKAKFIDNPRNYFWDIVLESHSLVDSVLAIEMDLRNIFPPDQQMCREMRGQSLVHTQCEEYAAAYHNRMNGMVEKRLKDAILSVGSAWYTAWVLAGQPDLSRLGQEIAVVDSIGTENEKLIKRFLKGRKHE